MEVNTSNSTLSKKQTFKRVESNTKNVLLSLMKEVKINSKLQNELLQCASMGKSLPFVPKELITPKNNKEVILKPKLLTLPQKPVQRSIRQIEQSGFYDVEKFRPDRSKIRSPHEKERLQNIMAFGQDLINVESTCRSVKSIEKTMESQDLFNEILLEIKERKDFLNDMHELGLSKKYLPEIQCQISLRLKELEKLDTARFKEIISEYDP